MINDDIPDQPNINVIPLLAETCVTYFTLSSHTRQHDSLWKYSVHGHYQVGDYSIGPLSRLRGTGLQQQDYSEK